MTDIRNAVLPSLFAVAWSYRGNALVRGRTAVGAAALSEDGVVFGGCNLQQRYRFHDIHAEIAAITGLLVTGRRRLEAIVVVSDAPGLTPCGACLDWILQIGGDECVVAWQQKVDGAIEQVRAGELMPYHPPYASGL